MCSFYELFRYERFIGGKPYKCLFTLTNQKARQINLRYSFSSRYFLIGANAGDVLIPAGCGTPLRLTRKRGGRGGTGYTIPDLPELVTDVLLSVGCYGDGGGREHHEGEMAGEAKNKTNVARLDQSPRRFLFTRQPSLEAERKSRKISHIFVVNIKPAGLVGSHVENGQQLTEHFHAEPRGGARLGVALTTAALKISPHAIFN